MLSDIVAEQVKQWQLSLGIYAVLLASQQVVVVVVIIFIALYVVVASLFYDVYLKLAGLAGPGELFR